MRRLVVSTLALAAVLAGVGIGLGQDVSKRKVVRVEEEEDAKAKATPAKSKLEEMLAEALKNNPDIRVAAAKVAKADAELNRTRLQVTQKIVELYYAIDAQKKTIALQEEKSAALGRQYNSGQLPFVEILGARQALTLAKAKLAELESQMPALLGKVTRGSEGDIPRITIGSDAGFKNKEGRLEILPPLQRATGPMADKIRKALETPITVNYKDVKFSEILKDLEKKASGLSFHVRELATGGQFGADEAKVTLHFDMPLPIAAILQATEDATGAHFIVRDYGILVTIGKLPPGALTVQDFMRQKPKEK